MTLRTWREDEFEDRDFDDRMLAALGTTSSIIEAELSLRFPQRRQADIIFVEPEGNLIVVEAKVSPTIEYENIVWLSPLGSLYSSEGKSLVIECRRVAELVNQAIVFSHSSIDELSQNLEVIESVSASHANLQDKETPKLEAIHPLTSPVFNQLAQVPTPTREAVQDVLNKFVTTVSHAVITKLPPLRLSLLEDSSYLLEWTFEDRRLGFSFEQTPRDSGWYFVFSTASSERYESGTMDQLEMSRLIGMMLKP
ncbi:MAG: hypothetical protein HYY46_25845 [Deltaproteobacteria bacterium]|nr:hypothetical protein [Deltaproteobacteria bacterium]